jgi:DNA-binding response OmpR family regulator
MTKILIVDDEAKIREVIKEYIEFSGYESDEAEDGKEAVEKCRDNNYDLIIMDIMMPKVDGITAIKEIKKFSDTPILVLSARTEEYDRLFGFEVGADDYVAKPFSPSEVVARIKAILSRINKQDKRDRFTYENLVIDFTGRTVSVNGERKSLTPKEYDLLFYLCKRSGIAITRTELLENIWGDNFCGDERTVDTHIKMLRNNLGEYRNLVSTVRGIGYRFDID